jgi:cytochrome c2
MPCHTIGKGKLVGPDLKDVTKRHDEAWLFQFIRNSQALITSGDPVAVQLFNDNNKIPMPPHEINDAQLRSLLKYIAKMSASAEAAAEQKTPQVSATAPAEVQYQEYPEDYLRKASRNYSPIFWVSFILFLLAFADLIKTKLVKARLVHFIIILITLFIMGNILVVEAIDLGRQQYYSPDQPIAFSHKIHAGQNQIDCKYCHFTVMESRHAGIPPVQLCMNCHTVVRQGNRTGTAEIDKIYKAIDDGRTIQWIRVHNLPSFTYFNHSQHVNAGKLDCSQCHGDVTVMERIWQVQSLSMGWCIECHRTHDVQFQNSFYTNYRRLKDEMDSGIRKRITVEDIGGTECSQCHY